jgi:type I restriction enzyme S subunit
VIRLGNVGINEFKDHDSAFIPIEYADELEAHAVVAGDVVVAGLGDDRMPLGRAAVVPDLGAAIVKADCYRLRPNDLVSPQYLAWVMSAPQTGSQIMLLARGATRARLNTKVVQQVEIPVPDRATQAEIVARSSAAIKKIDVLIAESERFIELSRERRAALITAAVTGQIDVREVA